MALPLPYRIEDEAIQGNFDEIAKQLPVSRKNVNLETTNLIGDTGQPAFENSWVNFDTTTFHGARYWKDAVGMVHIEGLVKNGTIGNAVFTLPDGYRPTNGHRFVVISNGAIGRVDISPTGEVVAAAGNNTYVSLSGILFRQES